MDLAGEGQSPSSPPSTVVPGPWRGYQAEVGLDPPHGLLWFSKATGVYLATQVSIWEQQDPSSSMEMKPPVCIRPHT